MAKYVLKPGSHMTWNVTTSGDTWVIKKSLDFEVYNGDGISDTSAQHNSRFEIAGHIKALDGEGLDLYGRNNTVVIAASGFIETAHGSGIAFEKTGYNGTLENHGKITSEFTGVSMTGASPVSGHQSTAEIVNYGRITGGEQNGIYSNSDDLKIVNKQGGYIGGGQYGYAITSVENDVSVLNNGTVSGIVNGSVGADTYTVDNKALKLVEDGFSADDTDTVNASVSWVLGANFEKLVLTGARAIDGKGNDQVNTLVGNGKSNVLTGMGGDDMLKGGGGADHFAFSSGAGHDTIADFKDGTDRIDLGAYTDIHGFKDIIGVTDSDKGAVVTLSSNGDTITLTGVEAHDIAGGDFLFG